LVLFPSLTVAKGVLWDRDLPKYATKSGLLNVIVSKELCSCHWIAHIPINVCLERGNLPAGSEKMVVIEPNESQHVMTVHTSILGRLLYGKGPEAWSLYNAAHPEYGCHIIHGPLEAAGR
jgi:hypothetical protein